MPVPSHRPPESTRGARCRDFQNIKSPVDPDRRDFFCGASAHQVIVFDLAMVEFIAVQQKLLQSKRCNESRCRAHRIDGELCITHRFFSSAWVGLAAH